MLIEAIGLREIPDRALRLIITSAAQNSSPRVLVGEFIGPLPNVAHQGFDAERPGAPRIMKPLTIQCGPDGLHWVAEQAVPWR